MASTGMDIDTAGNVYMACSAGVAVYSSAGSLIETLGAPAQPLGVCFGNADKRTLFIITQNGLYSLWLATQGVTIDGAPVISSTTRSISSPGASDAPYVTTTASDDGSVSAVNLSYTVGGTGLPANVFTETFASTPATTWTGSGASYPWTVTYPTGCPVLMATQANYGSGNACGVQFKLGDSALADTMITTTNGINVAGTAATVQFYLNVPNASSSEGWTFQIDSGSGFVTCLSESASKHSWQLYSYTLASAQLVSNMKMRFQFQGNGTSDVVNLDDITVSTTFGATTLLPMLDDGQHGDGAAGDGVYGAQIPAQAAGTTVCYYVTATDNTGLSTADPASAPTYYSYVVGHASSSLRINELQTNTTSYIPTTDYSTQTVGTLINNSSSAYPGYTIVDPMMGKTTYLINNSGQVVHSWTSAYDPGRSCYLLPNGNLIRSGALTSSPVNTGGGEGGIIEQRDWNGNLLWAYTCSGTNADGTGYEQHHDFVMLPNGDILMLVVVEHTNADAIAAGFNPSLFDANLSAGGKIQVDEVWEVQPSGTNGGTIVWKWSFWDHLVQNYSSTAANYGSIANPYLLNANCGQHTIQFFNHANGIAYNSALDEIMISARNQNEIYVIDHGTTTAQAASHARGAHNHGGDFLYRWGDPANYGASGTQTLFQQHDPTWIPAGYPGAGDILVFNNGEQRPGGVYSSVDEFTPPVDASGNYTLAAGSAYGPTKANWTWTATPASSFYNADVGGAQRLPNGDTLICYGEKGEAWEVNPAGQIVWDYQNPCTGSSLLYQGDSLPADPHQSGGYLTTIFRCERYSLSYGAFSGLNLAPGATIEQYRDVIELHNPGASAIDLGGMYLTNNLSAPTLWQIPSGISIPAGGYVLFYADGQTSATSASGRHAGFTLSAAGGSVGLFDTNGITEIDAIAYPAESANVSYGRAADGSNWGPLASSSLGAINGKIATSMSCQSATGVYGSSATLAATLTEAGAAVANELVNFAINGVAVGTATTDLNGIATLTGVSLAGIHAGTYAAYITASFASDSSYASANGSANLIVTQAGTTTAITSSLASPARGQAVTFTATITPASGSGVTGTVQFQIDGVNAGSPVSVSGNVASYTTSALSVGSHSITAVYSGDGNFSSSASASFSQGVIPPAQIINVLVSSSAWTGTYLSYLGSHSLGTADGFSIVGANQLKTLPWINLNQIKIIFNEDVTSSTGVNGLQNLLFLGGISTPSYSVSGFSYISAKHMGVWTFASALAADRLTLSLSDQVTDSYGNRLDGEWVDQQAAASGNGLVGGVFTAHLNALPGDVDRNGFVLGSDTSLVYNQQGQSTTKSNYNALYDVNGDGFILGNDTSWVYNRQGGRLPSGTAPSSPFGFVVISSPVSADLLSQGQIVLGVSDVQKNIFVA